MGMAMEWKFSTQYFTTKDSKDYFMNIKFYQLFRFVFCSDTIHQDTF